MNVKKEVFERIKKALDEERMKIDAKINRNKYTMKQLVFEQEVLKRERSELHRLINDIRN